MIGTRHEREQAALAEQRERYLAAGPKAVTAPVGPGRRPEEARQAAKAAAAERAEEERRSALEQAERLKALSARINTEVGQARFDLERAADALDHDALTEAAARLIALETAAEAVRGAGRRFGASHRSAMWYGVGAQRV